MINDVLILNLFLEVKNNLSSMIDFLRAFIKFKNPVSLQTVLWGWLNYRYPYENQ